MMQQPVISVEPLSSNLQLIHEANANRSLQEVVRIDTTLAELTVDKKDEESLSPTFKPYQLSFKSANMPLQLQTDKKEGKSPNAAGEGSTTSKKKLKSRKGNTLAPVVQSTPSRNLNMFNELESSNNTSQPVSKRPTSRTSHQQDSSYKPLFTDQASQRKKFQQLQMQVKNYDNVIRNSYERVEANKHLLAG